MKMIITGATGFIGSYLLNAGRAIYGQDVTSFSSKPLMGSHIVYRNANDLGLNPEALSLVEGAEVLIHAGAFTPKSGVDANQVVGCNANIKFTENLLALPWTNLKKIVFLSTLDVYANVDGPISESTPTGPDTLYGLSKLYCERMVALYAAKREFANQVLRIGHVYGPGEEKYSKVLPRAIQSIVSGKDVELWGEGNELRSFIYIDDVVTAIFNAVELVEQPGVINVVGGNAISIRNLLEKLISIGGRDTAIVRREFSGIARDLVFNNTKIKNYLLPNETHFSVGLEAEFKHVQNMNAMSIKKGKL
jgi:UDP-glucose 4-epimerase